MTLELYRYAPGPASEGMKHSHEEYQFCLSLDFPGEYRYRGERYDVPVGSIGVIHPGEVHSTRDPFDREVPATFRVMYVDPVLLKRAAEEIAGRNKSLPFFSNPIVLDRKLFGDFLGLHVELEEGTFSRLASDVRLLSVLTKLIALHADTGSTLRSVGEEHQAVRLAKEYLEYKYTENVSLEKLSHLTDLSPYYLAQVFCQEVGIPPHAYQVQVRVYRARDLLLRGWPIAWVAQQTGFADQSHLTRHFKRLTVVTPGQYAQQNSKNVQDNLERLF